MTTSYKVFFYYLIAEVHS